MKVAIVGSRGFKDLTRVRSYVAALAAEDVVVSGGARGVDRVAERAARERGMRTAIIVPEWGKLGRGAGVIRNALIVEACDRLVAFWDGKSAGTWSSINLARKAGKPVEVIE